MDVEDKFKTPLSTPEPSPSVYKTPLAVGQDSLSFSNKPSPLHKIELDEHGVPKIMPPFKTNPISEDYDIFWDKSLGTGVQGAVVLCKCKRTGTKYALKCMRPTHDARREIALQILCKHPNIVDIHDIYDNVLRRGSGAPRKHWFLMVQELLEGGELFDRLSEKEFFSEQEASVIMGEITSAVHFIHSLNIAHRDLKPENLLYTSKGPNARLKLCDFGFAKVDEGNLQSPKFTAYYAAGELVEAQRVAKLKKEGVLPPSYVFAYDKSVDMWALGVILYILLCGYAPFESETENDDMDPAMKQRIRNGDFVFHDDYWSSVSDEAKKLVSDMLNTEPSNRPSAYQLLKHPWIAGNTCSATPLPTPHRLLEQPGMINATTSAMRTQNMNLRRQAVSGTTVLLKDISECNAKLMKRRQDRMANKEPTKARNSQRPLGLSVMNSQKPPAALPLPSPVGGPVKQPTFKIPQDQLLAIQQEQQQRVMQQRMAQAQRKTPLSPKSSTFKIQPSKNAGNSLFPPQ
eukprot:m.225373 g.225373  ORF g.225373 m.225373 type:complete len:516 (-) comp26385_c0_seq1:66-1613(-)